MPLPYGLRLGGCVRRKASTSQELQQQDFGMHAELFTAPGVDKDVAGVMGNAQFFDHFAHRDVGEVVLPSGVNRHVPKAHRVPEPDARLDTEHNRHRQLGED